jgi:cell division protein ZapD
MDVASRADLKSDLLKELDRHRGQLMGYRGNPHISEEALDAGDRPHRPRPRRAEPVAGQGRPGAGRQRLADEHPQPHQHPGGTCEFDLPSYYAWQQHDAERRRADLPAGPAR